MYTRAHGYDAARCYGISCDIYHKKHTPQCHRQAHCEKNRSLTRMGNVGCNTVLHTHTHTFTEDTDVLPLRFPLLTYVLLILVQHGGIQHFQNPFPVVIHPMV